LTKSIVEKYNQAPELNKQWGDIVMVKLIGRDIMWENIIRQVFSVIEFDSAGTVVEPGDKVKTSGFLKPYGYLIVISPILEEIAYLPITHKNDFVLATTVFDESPKWVQAIQDNEAELLVTYVPKRKLPLGFGGISHCLHYALTPPGTLSKYYEIGNGIHKTNPEVEKIFGELVWKGEIRVQVNANPSLD
jgi:hypothetical protein